MVGGDVTWLPSWGPSRMWEGRSKLQRRGRGQGWRPAKAGSVVSQGVWGQRRKQEAGGLLSAAVDFAAHCRSGVTPLCWVQDGLGWAEGLEESWGK